MNHINLIKYSILALLVMVFGSLALASDGENAQKQSSEASLVTSDPDYRMCGEFKHSEGLRPR